MINGNKDHWYDGWFYDKFIAPSQDKLFEQIKNLIEPNSKVIDVGCGTGRFSFSVTDKCKYVLGVDLSSRNIDRANLTLSKYPNNKISFQHKNINDVIAENNSHYDYAVLTYVIHEVNVDERVKLLTEISMIADKIIIGDSVNLSARLEGANKQYKTKTLISDNTFQPIAGQVVARELDLITVVGKNKPLKIYELFGLVGDKIAPEYFSLIEKFSEALVLYRQRNWEKAIKNFEDALKIKPDDYPSKLYIERSQAFIKTPPPDDWDGVFVMKTK
ncbi:MAG: methyltransferase domain-containing protein [Bacteroidota bacterium]|nr:methyltransferase domain-containing protein [Bacteroidota bacterium]